MSELPPDEPLIAAARADAGRRKAGLVLRADGRLVRVDPCLDRPPELQRPSSHGGHVWIPVRTGSLSWCS
jgi:hypothetical protein